MIVLFFGGGLLWLFVYFLVKFFEVVFLLVGWVLSKFLERGLYKVVYGDDVLYGGIWLIFLLNFKDLVELVNIFKCEFLIGFLLLLLLEVLFDFVLIVWVWFKVFCSLVLL